MIAIEIIRCTVHIAVYVVYIHLYQFKSFVRSFAMLIRPGTCEESARPYTLGTMRSRRSSFVDANWSIGQHVYAAQCLNVASECVVGCLKYTISGCLIKMVASCVTSIADGSNFTLLMTMF